MKIAIVLILLALVAVTAVPACAQTDLYDNGPINGTTNAWTINFGFVVSNSFTFGSSATISGLNFAAWVEPGDVLQSAEVGITSSEFGGTSFFDQTVNFTQSGCASNQFGFNVCTETSSFSGPSLNAGTYWLNLQNASTTEGNPLYWDENSGPSRASENSVGTIPSESFTLDAGGCGLNRNSPDCGPPPTTPEPGSFLLFGSGVIAIFGFSRKLF